MDGASTADSSCLCPRWRFNKPDMPCPEMGPDAPRKTVWLVNNRTYFSREGWASLVGHEEMHITVLSDVNHFSIVAPGPHMVDIAGFIQWLCGKMHGTL